MGKYTGLLICSDFDGTLAYRGKVSEANLEAIRCFREGGGLFTLCTGRYPTILEELGLSNVCNTHMVAMNGAILYDPMEKKYLFEGVMDEAYREPLLKICENPEGIQQVVFCMREQSVALSNPWEEPERLWKLMGCRPYKLLFHVDGAYSEMLKKRIVELSGDRYAVTRSWISGIEVQEAYYDKGKTARRLANMVGADQLICVGDYENDLSMIREADLSYAMGNAVDCIKDAADRLTASAEEDGIAKMIDSL